MSHRLPYLAEEAIEHDAAQLLAEYAETHRVALTPPIPIEDVIEKHLRLSIDFDDLHALHHVPRLAAGETTILGAIFGDGGIFVDESLDPDEHPSQEGRYRFTLAHEIGHWRLHRHLLMGGGRQPAFLRAARGPAAICQTRQRKTRGEWQADCYASCLLMPRPLVVAAWADWFPRHKDRFPRFPMPTEGPVVEPASALALMGDSEIRKRENQDLEQFCRPLAQRFAVSAIALRIRLEGLGLLCRSVSSQRLPAIA